MKNLFAPVRVRAVLVTGIGLVLVWLLHFQFIDRTRSAALAAGEASVQAMSRAYAEHARSSFRLIDVLSLDLRRLWVQDKQLFDRQLEAYRQNIADISVQVGVTDRDGGLVYTDLGLPAAPVNLADREHIRVQLDSKADTLFVSRPVKGRVSKKWSIQFTRQVNRAGVVDGVLVISVDPQYFANYYRAMSVDSQRVISMVRSTGERMARFPDSETDSAVGRVVTDSPYLSPGAPVSGVFRRVAQIDGVDRMYGYYQLPDYGVVLVSGVSTEAVLAPYYSERKWSFGLAAGFSLALVLAALLVTRRLEERERSARGLARANVELELRVVQRTAELEQTLREKDELGLFMTKLLASSPAALYTRRVSDGRVTHITANISRLSGWEPSDITAGTGFWAQQVHPQDREQLVSAPYPSLPMRAQTRRYRIRHKDGRYLWLSDSLQLVGPPSGEPDEVVGALVDITEQVQLEEQLGEAQKLEAIGQLTGGLAHDFNNLLGIVVGNLDEIGDDLPLAGRLRQQHTAALDAALRGAEVTRSLLAVARRQPLEVKAYDLNALVVEMLPLLNASAGSAVKVLSQFAPGAMMARLDAGGLSNVVLNLAINARDAMQDMAGERVLTLRTRREQIVPGAGAQALAPGWYAVLEVCDNGHGMSQSVREQAFEPFFTTKERGKGTGLGLAMVYGYATQLGGTAQIESAEGTGTTVSVYLPMAQQAQLEEAAETGDPVTVWGDSIPTSLGAQASVLVVDDEAELCTLACDWLVSLGYEAVGVHSPDAALQRLATGSFDILFTDVVMPSQIDGVELARRAKRLQPALKVLLTSGYAQTLFSDPDLPGEVLSKPYRRKELARAMAALTPLG